MQHQFGEAYGQQMVLRGFRRAKLPYRHHALRAGMIKKRLRSLHLAVLLGHQNLHLLSIPVSASGLECVQIARVQTLTV